MFNLPATVMSLILAISAASLIYAHGVLVEVHGSNSHNGVGFGVIPSTPRVGGVKSAAQQDTSIIIQSEITSGQVGPCGRTPKQGALNLTLELDFAVSQGLPQAFPNGTVLMTLHQQNGDGAGPYQCEVSADATGQNFVSMQITQNVPGNKGISNASQTNFTLAATLPEDIDCTGGPNGDACVVRCTGGANSQFGGCAAIALSEEECDDEQDDEIMARALSTRPVAHSVRSYTGHDFRMVKRHRLSGGTL